MCTHTCTPSNLSLQMMAKGRLLLLLIYAFSALCSLLSCISFFHCVEQLKPRGTFTVYDRGPEGILRLIWSHSSQGQHPPPHSPLSTTVYSSSGSLKFHMILIPSSLPEIGFIPQSISLLNFSSISQMLFVQI